ncbi:hypothetical protein P153DRAFT_399750 [Dothidotthia symphoricarpi CBS 119687]|uniref:C2H2-type domain-containing protein n=1 Tax=Dothidotthia symphoricarpi CBS 119687 TaxID=1392245 RepID=A0A6A6A6Q5_9PLEO|nr:uncharacterized protein P153DRAFT_399750 [Dothidotthia symphoricarpi CBS 119687]KAF2126301.1 hypothetical protein P153DRAFT_399750 [Dothidotthia symphoricarpi CBS 119687]
MSDGDEGETDLSGLDFGADHHTFDMLGPAARPTLVPDTSNGGEQAFMDSVSLALNENIASVNETQDVDGQEHEQAGGVTVDSTGAVAVDTTSFSCQFCNKSYDNLASLKRHLKRTMSVCYRNRTIQRDDAEEPDTKVARTAVASRKQRKKRKATVPPEDSPSSTHVSKRPPKTIKLEDVTRPDVGTSASLPKDAVDLPLSKLMSHSATRDHIPQVSLPAYRDDPLTQDSRASLQPPRHILPSVRSLGYPVLQEFRQSQDGRPIAVAQSHQSLFQAQPNVEINHGRFNSYGNGYGSSRLPSGTDFSPQFKAQQMRKYQQRRNFEATAYEGQYHHARSQLPFPDPHIQGLGVGTNIGHNGGAVLSHHNAGMSMAINSNTNFQVYENSSLGQSQGPADMNHAASAPGSRMPSRQPSPDQYAPSQSEAPLCQSSVEYPQNQDVDISNVNDAHDNDETCAYQNDDFSVSHQNPRSLAKLPSASPAPDTDDPVLKLRIHAKKHDSAGRPIFFFLEIRGSQKFGPVLEAYCQKRNKRYRSDWKFIYMYPAPTPENPNHKKYVDLVYDMTPNDVHDMEYPDVSLKHLDTIYILEAKPCTAVGIQGGIHKDSFASSLPWSKPSGGEVNVMDHEAPANQHSSIGTEIYDGLSLQNRDLRTRVGELHSVVTQQANSLAQQNHHIGELRGRNHRLEKENQYLRQVRQAHPLPRMPSFIPSYGSATRPSAPLPLGIRTIGAQNRPTAFVDRCESVREPDAQGLKQQLDQLQFPSYAHNAYDHPANDSQQQYRNLPAASYHDYVAQIESSKSRIHEATTGDQLQSTVGNAIRDVANKVGAEFSEKVEE